MDSATYTQPRHIRLRSPPRCHNVFGRHNILRSYTAPSPGRGHRLSPRLKIHENRIGVNERETWDFLIKEHID